MNVPLNLPLPPPFLLPSFLLLDKFITAKYKAGAFLSVASGDVGLLDQRLMEAVLSNDLGGVFRLLCHGANANTPHGMLKSTALHLAASMGSRCAVALLLLSGADATQADANDDLPATVARRNGFFDIAAELDSSSFEMVTALGQYLQVSAPSNRGKLAEELTALTTARIPLSSLTLSEYFDLLVDVTDEIDRRLLEQVKNK